MWPGLGIRGCMGEFGEKLRAASPTSSQCQVAPGQTKAEPISDGGHASWRSYGIETNCSQRRVGENNSEDTNISEESRGGSSPGAAAQGEEGCPPA